MRSVRVFGMGKSSYQRCLQFIVRGGCLAKFISIFSKFSTSLKTNMASKSSPPKLLNTQSNALSGHAPSILQLSLWDLLAEATRVPLAAELTVLLDDLDEAIADLPIEQRISVAGEGLAKVGEIVGLRAEIRLQEINQLLNPGQEPSMPLDAFDRYVRQSMAVDLGQFCAAPELPEVERGYIRSVAEPMSEEEAIAEIVAAIYDVEPESPLELSHDEDVSGWSAKIRDCLTGCGEMRFWSIVEATNLMPIDVWLGLLLGDTGCLVRRRSWGVVDGEDFYGVDGLWVR